MKNVLTLILVIGLMIGGWMNREKLSDLWMKRGAPDEEASSSVGGSPSTPHPAREAQAQAMTLYPGLALANSALNKKFVALYEDAQATDPGLLSRPD